MAEDWAATYTEGGAPVEISLSSLIDDADDTNLELASDRC